MISPRRVAVYAALADKDAAGVARALAPQPRTVYHRSKRAAEQLLPLLADVGHLLHLAHRRGDRLLFEGAQGTLLDIDHGTYPFVTSSNCVAGNAAAGSGVGPGLLHYVLGIGARGGCSGLCCR